MNSLAKIHAYRHADELRNCHSKAQVVIAPSCEHVCVDVFPKSCHKRICPLCEAQRSARNYDVVEPFFKQMKFPVMITLTHKNVNVITREKMKKNKADFRKLRNRVSWKKRVKGGFCNTEVTEKGKGWHPHFHILVEGRDAWFVQDKRTGDWIPGPNYWPKEELSREWKEITGDSFVVDIQVVKNLHELTKYATKVSAIQHDGQKLIELMAALKGVRLFFTFGEFYGAERKKKRKKCCKHGCEYEWALQVGQDLFYLDAREENRNKFKLRSEAIPWVRRSYASMLERKAA